MTSAVCALDAATYQLCTLVWPSLCHIAFPHLFIQRDRAHQCSTTQFTPGSYKISNDAPRYVCPCCGDVSSMHLSMAVDVPHCFSPLLHPSRFRFALLSFWIVTCDYCNSHFRSLVTLIFFLPIRFPHEFRRGAEQDIKRKCK